MSHGRATPLQRALNDPDPKTAERAAQKVRLTLAFFGGRIDKAAHTLHVSSRTLSRWLRRFGIQKFASELRAKNNVPGPRP